MMDIKTTLGKARLNHKDLVQLNVALYATQLCLGQRATHTAQRFISILSVREKFRDQRVVMRWQLITRVKMGIDPDTWATRRHPSLNLPGSRHKGERIFRIDPTFNRMPGNLDLILLERQLGAERNSELLSHNVYASHQLRYRVFNLDSSVHFNEEELSIFIEEFKRPSATVANQLTSLYAALPYPADSFTIYTRRRTFLNDFLIATLHRAVPLT